MKNKFKNLIKCNLMTDSSKSKIKKRNLGIDLARIISMIFIINHHIMYHGGPLFGTKVESFEKKILLFLNTIFCSGVNIFGMISGFVGFHNHRYSNLIYLLFQTSLYNYIIAYIIKIKKPNIAEDLERFKYPLFISNYWYFNAYFTMYFFLPMINSGIKHFEKKEFGIFNLSIFLLFSCFNQIKHYSVRFEKDLFHFANGFTYMWLIILYFYGSYFGKFNNYNHNYNYVIIFLICCIILFFAAFIRNVLIINKIRNNNIDISMIVEYTSPSSVIISICFIILFSKLIIKTKLFEKIISFFAPLTYGVYLIHNHILVLRYVIKDNYSWLLKYSFLKLLLLEILESLKIFVVSSFIDYLRFILFKLLRIKQLCVYFSNLIYIISNAVLFIFELFY